MADIRPTRDDLYREAVALLTLLSTVSPALMKWIRTATLLMLYQLRKRASPRTLPADLGLTSCIEFHRRELRRQRDARESIWRWYIALFVPSFFVFTIAVY